MKSARTTWPCGSRGASLIEVMIAVALTAITALGLIASQLWIAREARAAALREHAALLADAVVEASRAPIGGEAELRQWRTRTASLLPQGEASISERVRGAPQGRRTRYVDCDGVSATGADMRVRQAFWRRVAIRNNEGSAP